MQFCDSKCQHCARKFWNWLKSREFQMNMALDGGTSFASAAATSVRPSDNTDKTTTTEQFRHGSMFRP